MVHNDIMLNNHHRNTHLKLQGSWIFLSKLQKHQELKELIEKTLGEARVFVYESVKVDGEKPWELVMYIIGPKTKI